MNLIIWIIFGGTVGAIASVIDAEKSEGNLVGSIGMGILGTIIGGLAANYLFGQEATQLSLSSFILALLAAALLLFAYKAIFTSPENKF